MGLFDHVRQVQPGMRGTLPGPPLHHPVFVLTHLAPSFISLDEWTTERAQRLAGERGDEELAEPDAQLPPRPGRSHLAGLRRTDR